MWLYERGGLRACASCSFQTKENLESSCREVILSRNWTSRSRIPSRALRVAFVKENVQRSKDEERSNGRSASRYESSLKDILKVSQSRPELEEIKNVHTHIKRKLQHGSAPLVVELFGVSGCQYDSKVIEVTYID